MTTDRDTLIAALARAVERRSGEDDALVLPGWDLAAWGSAMAEAKVLELSNGEVLVRREDPTNDLYFVVSGLLEVTAPQSGSVTLTHLASIEPGSVVGEVAFFDAHGRSASVWSRDRSVLLALSRTSFDALRRTHPDLAADLAFAIGRILAHRLREALGGSKKSSKRLRDYF